MTDPSPYQTPGARLADTPEPVLRKFRWAAVVIGAAADLGASTLTGIVLIVLVSLRSQSGSMPEMMAQLNTDWTFLMSSMLTGGACTVLGGYVAGRIARHAFLLHALAAGLLSLVVGIMLFAPDDGPYAGIVALLGYGSHLPLAALGGRLAARRDAGAAR